MGLNDRHHVLNERHQYVLLKPKYTQNMLQVFRKHVNYMPFILRNERKRKYNRMSFKINSAQCGLKIPWIYCGIYGLSQWFCCNNNLTHWGRVTHICVSKLIIIGSDNGLSPGRRQAIIWTNAGILLIGPFGTNFSEISIEIHTFPFKKMHLNMSAKWRLFRLGLDELSHTNHIILGRLFYCPDYAIVICPFANFFVCFQEIPLGGLYIPVNLLIN